MTELRLPKLNNNDTHYLLVEWLVDDGGRVQRGDIVATVETSKAAEDLVCEDDGVLRHQVAVGSECEPGHVLARIVPAAQSSAASDSPAPVATATPTATPDDLVVTAPARARLAELGIGVERLRVLGRRVIRREDVDELLQLEQRAAERPAAVEPDPPARWQQLPRHQQAVADTVSRSHATVPPAYLAIRVEVTEALALAAQLRTELRRLVDLPELLVAAVARQHADFPLCFATPGESGSVAVPPAPHVGITIDLGTGLHVPVIRDAARRSVPEIAEMVSQLRDTALRGKFRASELVGANILVALHTDDDVLFGVPIVFPGQTCALSLSGTRFEPSVDADGTVGARPVVTLGIAHDHRVVNGRDATLFLRAIKAALEDPRSLVEPPGDTVLTA